MTIGYNKPLYVLPFDHRATFSKNMFGWQEPLSPEQTADIAAAKQVIFDAFKVAVAGGVSKDRAGILVDEQFGAAILRDARKQGFVTACPAEKSGQDEFDFEYGPDFARHIEEFSPTFCKVLVALQPRRRQGPEPPPGCPLEAAVRPPARDRPTVHVRVACASTASAGRASRQRQEGL
jgi:myo-inositol catabolism protein IolC